MPRFFLIAAASYLLGSIPFGYLLVRIFRGEDVRHTGSGNIGATNVARKSPALGVLTLLLDALKGSAAVAVGVLPQSSSFLEHISTTQIPWRQLLPPTSLAFAAWAAASRAVRRHRPRISRLADIFAAAKESPPDSAPSS